MQSSMRKEDNWVTLFGFEVSHVTPLWPHKLLVVVQLKLPFEVNELYQLTKIVCSSGCKAPILKLKFSKSK